MKISWLGYKTLLFRIRHNPQPFLPCPARSNSLQAGSNGLETTRGIKTFVSAKLKKSFSRNYPVNLRIVDEIKGIKTALTSPARLQGVGAGRFRKHHFTGAMIRYGMVIVHIYDLYFGRLF